MDLSYFEEPYESLVSEATYDSEGIEISPAIYETLQRRKPTPRTKSLTDVERVIGRHKGGNDKAIDIMVASYLDGLQWAWLEAYDQYVSDKEAIDHWNANTANTVSHTETVRVVTGEGDEATVSYEEQEVLYEEKELPVAPVRPPELTVEQWRIDNYAMLRAAAYPSVEEQLAMQYDDQTNGTTVWIDKQNAIKAKYPKE